MTKFLILVPTHNRNALLNDTLKSVFEQTHTDWRLLVSDNASPLPAAQTIPLEYQRDPRFNLARRETLVSSTEHGEFLLQTALQYDFDNWMILADDDLLLPFALAEVARLGEGHAVIQSSFYGYYEDRQTLGFGDMLNDPTAEIIAYGSRPFLDWFIESNGIRLKNAGRQRASRPPIGPTHLSACWVTHRALELAIQKYGRLSTRPFGDTGFFKFGLEAGPCVYINRPLALVRFHRSSYGNAAGHAALAARTRLAQQHDILFRYSRLHALTFANGVREACLNLLADLGLPYTPHLGAGFLLRHTQEIVRDRPWTRATLRDLGEALPRLALQSPEIIFFLLRYLLRHEKLNYDMVEQTGVASIWEAMALAAENEGHTYLAHCRRVIQQRKAARP